MHDHEVVGVRVELGCGVRVVAREDREILWTEPLGIALQGVVNRLGDAKELLRAAHHAPLDVEPGVRHQRHEGVEDLRDAAAERRGGQMQDSLAAERVREPPHLVHQPARNEARVVREGLPPRVHELQHEEARSARGSAPAGA